MAHSLELLVSVLERNIDNRGKTPPLSPMGYPLIEVKHIQEDHIYPVFEDTKYVDQATWDTWFRAHLEPGDILFSTVGSIARSCMVPEKPKFCIAQNVLGFRVDRSKADPRFVYYAINDSFFQHEVHGRTIETVQKSIKVHDLKTCRIPLPSLPEQHAIANILGTLDDKIELNRQMNETLEAMARALFKSWFVDFDPVRAKAEGRDPGLPKPIADLFPDSFEDSELREIPKGWEVGPLDSVLVLQRGFDLPATRRTSGAYPVLAASGPSGTHNEFMVRGPGVTTGRSGVLGKVFYVDDDFWPLNTSLWVKEFRHSRPAYAFHLLRGIDFAMFNAGSAVPTLNRNHVHNLPTLLPPMGLIDAFEQVATSSLKRQKHNDHQSRTLATMRDTLLPKLISGELRVRAANNLVQEATA